MIRSLLVAIALLGAAIDASAQGWLSEALYDYRHDTAPAGETPSPDLMSLALPALGAEEPPCDGVPIEGELVLDRDIACSVTLRSDAILDLNGFTIAGGVTYPLGGIQNATVKNGTILRGGVFNVGFGDCTSCTIENVRVIDTVGPWAVQPGGNARITGCFFSGNGVAIDLFYGGSAVVENSIFDGNAVGVSIQKDNDSVISSNEFRANNVGVRLFAERLYGASYNTIAYNLFVDNTFGLSASQSACSVPPFGRGCMNGNAVIGNRFLENRGSGLLVDFSSCAHEFTECENIDASIEDNVFSGNGFEPPLSLFFTIPMNDGLSVVGPSIATDGLTVARNVAVSNSDLGIEAPGVTDGGGNRANGNGNPLQCVGVTCVHPEQCRDGIDNDGDGKADYLAAAGGDPGCVSPTSRRENPQCQDGLDNDKQTGIDSDGGASLDLDNDGSIDAEFNPATPVVGPADPQCLGKPYRNREAMSPPICGLGAELALVMPLLGIAASRRRRARESNPRPRDPRKASAGRV